jgi:hypothetical protein
MLERDGVSSLEVAYLLLRRSLVMRIFFGVVEASRRDKNTESLALAGEAFVV